MTCHLSEQSKAIIGKYAKSDHADEDYIFPILTAAYTRPSNRFTTECARC